MAGRAHVYSGRWQAVQMFTGEMAGRPCSAHVYRGRWQAELIFIRGRWQAVQMFTGVDGRQAMHCTCLQG